MPTKKRFKTKYAGVYYIESSKIASRKPERIYYIMYRKDGKLVEEKAGRQFQDDMTPARAARIRGERIDGSQSSNKERRNAILEKMETETQKWTIDRIWQKYKSQKPDSKNLRTDENRYENYIKPKFGSFEPKNLIQLEVDDIRTNLLKKIKPQTVKHVLTLLKRTINFGVKKGLCSPLPFTIEMPKVHNIKTEDLNPDQLTKLLESIEQDINIQAANLMKMALYTGCRRGELFKLKWDHINFDRGFISLVDPKGGPDEQIPLNDLARGLLDSHPRSDSPFVFPGRGGNQRTDINKQVNRIKNRAGLPKDFRPLHGLRHVYASMLASSGKVDMYVLQKLLTHKSPQMTQRYAHLRDEALRKASDVAGDLIGDIINGKEEKQEKKAQKMKLAFHK